MKIKYLTMACVIFQGCLISFNGFAEVEAGTALYTKEQVHGSQQDCNICHISHRGGGIGLVTKIVAELCLECHPDRIGGTEHIVGVIPSMNIEELPLKDGKINCVTCHDPHKNTYVNMLRVPQEKLCFSCHEI